MANSNEFNVSFHIDNFLFSDDDDEQEDQPTTAVAGGPQDDIVPDSSDEASTGPALDMDLESADEDGPSHVIQNTTMDQDSYAHANASSGTRHAFKTSHNQYQQDPLTVNPRELAVVPTTFTTSKTPESRDSDAPGSVHYNTSIATTEVIPTQRDDTSSVKTVSPGDRPPHMLGRQLLQPRQAASAAEGVKGRQRPKAKPLALASKDVKAAIRGKSPPRKAPNEGSSVAHTKSRGTETDHDDDDDELRLKSSKSKQNKGGGIEASTTRDNRTSLTGVIELDSDDDVPLTKTSTSKSKAAGSKSHKGKQRAAFQDIDSDDSDAEQAKEAANYELMQEILKANAKESDDDDDYDGKATSKDKWNRKGKKKNARRSSKAPSEEPAAKVSARSSRAKGRPSAVYPSSKKSTSRLSIADSDDPQSDEAILVGARRTSKAGKIGTAAEEKARSKKGPQPRSKEFLDDEDMEDDVLAASPQNATKSERATRDTAKDPSSAKDQVEEGSEAETAPLPPSSDAPVAARSKPTKTYGKKGRKSATRVQESEDNEDPAVESSVLLSDKTAKESSSVVVEKALGDQKERSSSREATSSRSKRSVSPAYAVIIDNSAKKTRMTTSRSSRDTNTKSRIADKAEPQHSGPERAASASSKSGTAQTIKKKASSKTKSALRIVDSEEDDEAEEEEEEEAGDEDEKTSKRPQDEESSIPTQAAQALLPTSKTSPGKVEPARFVLQTKNANVTSPTKASAKLAKAEGGVATPLSFLKGKASSVDIKPVIGSTGKRFHDMVVAKGGGQGIRAQGLSKRSRIPTLLSFRAPPPPKKPPLPQAPVKKKKKGEEVYSDEDQEELNDQPEEWWDRDDFYEWEKRKRKRAKAKGEIDSDDERDFAQQQKKMKKETSTVVLDATTVAEVEHFSD